MPACMPTDIEPMLTNCYRINFQPGDFLLIVVEQLCLFLFSSWDRTNKLVRDLKDMGRTFMPHINCVENPLLLEIVRGIAAPPRIFFYQ